MRIAESAHQKVSAAVDLFIGVKLLIGGADPDDNSAVDA